MHRRNRLTLPVPLNCFGKIISGDWAGRYLFIKSDPHGTGGFYVFQSKEPRLQCFGNYDAFFVDEHELHQFLQRSDFEIEWRAKE